MIGDITYLIEYNTTTTRVEIKNVLYQRFGYCTKY